MEKQNLIKDSLLLELAAEIFLDKSVLEFNKKRLKDAIDEALQNRNEAEFIKLTEQLRKIENN